MPRSKYDQITLGKKGFMENYEIWDHHGERRTEVDNMEGTNPP